MTQAHSVRVKKWTQLRPEDFNGTSSASLNARRRHTASPDSSSSSLPLPSFSSSDDNPPASPELPRFQVSDILSSSSHSRSPSPLNPFPPPLSASLSPSSYVYHQHVYYQSPSHRQSPPSHSYPHLSEYDNHTNWQWQDQDSSLSYHHSLPLPCLPSLASDSTSRRVFRNNNEDHPHLFSPYSRSLSSKRPFSSRSAPSSPTSHLTPSYDFPSPPTSPRSPILSSPSHYNTKSWKQKINPLINAVEEEMTAPSSQDSVVPSVQKMKICNLILNN